MSNDHLLTSCRNNPVSVHNLLNENITNVYIATLGMLSKSICVSHQTDHVLYPDDHYLWSTRLPLLITLSLFSLSNHQRMVQLSVEHQQLMTILEMLVKLSQPLCMT